MALTRLAAALVRIREGLSLDALFLNSGGSTLIPGSRRVFNINDYGAKPDYNMTTHVIVTDSYAAYVAAALDASKCNGIVETPACPVGFAYYSSGRIRGETSFYNGVSFIGHGLRSSILVSGVESGPAIGAFTSSGEPVSTHIDEMQIRSHANLVNPAVFVGWGVVLNNMTFQDHSRVWVEGFEEGVRLYNQGSSVAFSFTEFNTLKKWWIRGNKTQIRLAKGASGNASFHGNSIDQCVLNVGPNQTGVKIDAGCVLYNSTGSMWAFGSDNTSVLIDNEGAWNGEFNFFFEGQGTLNNKGSMIFSDGAWGVENSTGELNDISTVPICHPAYRTAKTPTGANWGTHGVTSLVNRGINTAVNFMADIFRLRGPNVEGIGWAGYDSGDWDNQGFYMASQSFGATGAESLTLRWLLALNNFISYRPTFGFKYQKGGAVQLGINSTGRATMLIGRKATGTVAANAGVSQTIQMSGIQLSVTNMSYDCELVLIGANGTGKHARRFTVFHDGQVNPGVNGALLKDVDMSGSPSGYSVSSAGIISFTITTSAAMNYTLTVVGFSNP